MTQFASKQAALARPKSLPALRSVDAPEFFDAGLGLFAEPQELWVAVYFPPQQMSMSLEQLAARAERFTPRISLAPPDGVLLEVKGSRKLFGGTSGLYQTIANEYASLGLQTAVAMAPNPLAALAGARANKPFIVTDTARLVGCLSDLPLGVLRWPEETIDRIEKIGVRTIGQALRLPRAGFARRFGVTQLLSLDRLTGRQADPRQAFRSRERFRGRRDFDHELQNHTAILKAAMPLLKELGEFLQARQCGAMRVDCLLHHRQAASTRCTLQLAEPAADAEHIAGLLAEHLAKILLPEPVRACELRSGPLLSRALITDPIWQAGEHGGEGAGLRTSAFIERLRARLGTEAVYSLRGTADHRPEKAWRRVDTDISVQKEPHSPWPVFTRPLWLLDVPQELQEQRGLPYREGTLRLMDGPERLEAGWWDGQPVARDYYTAVDGGGSRLWIFRERKPSHRWYLHGIFG